jgi:hypothetical protein
VPKVAFAKVQMVQKVEEILNEFKRTRLVSRDMGGRMEREVRWVGGEWECDLHMLLCLQGSGGFGKLRKH